MDVPRRRNWLWQPWLLCATWYFADILVIEMYTCGYFSSNNTCGDRNFLNLMGFAFGQPVLAILAMRQNRLFATIGPVQWIILIATTLMTQDDYPKLFYRTVVNCEWKAWFAALTVSRSVPRVLDRDELPQGEE
jgi:hypothetical protein